MGSVRRGTIGGMRFDVGEYVTLTILYSLIALTMVEALLRLWLVREPSSAVKLRLLTLALPPLIACVVTLAFRERSSVLATYNVVLFESENWFQLIGGNKAIALALFALMAVGSGAMFLFQTVLPVWRQYSTGKRQRVADPEQFPKLRNALLSLPRRLSPLPRIVVLDQRQPAAYVCGLRRLSVFLSTGLIEMLDEEELAAVLAHEISHIRKGDMCLSWVIFLLRGLMFYNPIAIIAFNQISLDMERACDEEVISLIGRRLSFGSALLKVYRATESCAVSDGRSRRVSFRLAAWEDQARRAFTEDRVKRILAARPQAKTSYLNLRLGLLAVAMAAVMILVT